VGSDLRDCAGHERPCLARSLSRHDLLAGHVCDGDGAALAYRAAGPYQPSLRTWDANMMMWFRLALTGDAGYIAEPLALIRAREKGKGTGAFSWSEKQKHARMLRAMRAIRRGNFFTRLLGLAAAPPVSREGMVAPDHARGHPRPREPGRRASGSASGKGCFARSSAARLSNGSLASRPGARPPARAPLQPHPSFCRR